MSRSESHPDPKEDTSAEEEEEEPTCPLFMDGLPSDFANNSALSALASLLQEEEEVKVKPPQVERAIEKSRGGKVRFAKGRHARRKSSQPYSTKPKASMGEAQLYLSMWKI